MSFHLELGSDGHSFNGKAIVVNSQTGKHMTTRPVSYDKASSQKAMVEEAVKKYGEPITAKGLPDMRGRKKKPTQDNTRKELSHVARQLAERKRARALKHIEPKVSMMKEKIHHDEDMSIAPIKAKQAKAIPPKPKPVPEGEWKFSGLGRWGLEGETSMYEGETVADYIKRIKRNRSQRSKKSGEATHECPICHKKFINLELHHTKMHAKFTTKKSGHHLVILKDNVPFAKLFIGGDTATKHGKHATIFESGDDLIDGHTYRLYEFNDGSTELYETTVAKGKHGTKHGATLGGVDGSMITNKIRLS